MTLQGCAVPPTLYFGVKFYPADPCKLKDDITRYQVFLQVRKDIKTGRLPVTVEEAAELCAYAVQSDYGDFDTQEPSTGYVSKFQFVPNQTKQLEEQIETMHKPLRGTDPATAESKYLDKVKGIEMYGVDLHPVKSNNSTEDFLGLSPTGIVVYKNKVKKDTYLWAEIAKIDTNSKIFAVKLRDKSNKEHTHTVELQTKTMCNHLSKCCFDHQKFFRNTNRLETDQVRYKQGCTSTGRGERRENLDLE